MTIERKRRSLKRSKATPANSPASRLGARIASSPPGRPRIEPAADDPAALFVEDHRQNAVEDAGRSRALKPSVSTNVLALRPSTSERQALGARPAEIEHRLLEDQASAHERPFAALDLDQLVAQQLVADDAISTWIPGFIARIVATCPGAVSRPRRSVKWTLVVSPVTGPNGAARSMSRSRSRRSR